MKKTIRTVLRFFRNLIINIFRIFPIKNAILFESNPDFNDNTYWWCDYLIKKGMDKKYKFYWIVKDHSIKKAPNNWNIRIIYLKPKTFNEFVKKYYAIFTSKFIFDSCVFVNKKRAKQVRIYLHHGTPIKRIDTYFDSFRKYDGIEIQSDWFAPFFMEYNLDPKTFLTFGLIRNDHLNDNVGYLKRKKLVFDDAKTIIWLPTYRQRQDHQTINSIDFDGSRYGLPVIKQKSDMEKINYCLMQNNIVLIVKPHPSQDMSYFNVKNLSNIKVITTAELSSDNIQLYQVLGESDALISDYSSVYFDYLLTDKPIGLTCDDIDTYRKKTGFSFDNYEDSSFEGNIKGTYIRNLNDFETFIQQVKTGFVSEEQKKAKFTFNKYVDFKSSDRLFNYLKDKYDF